MQPSNEKKGNKSRKLEWTNVQGVKSLFACMEYIWRMYILIRYKSKWFVTSSISIHPASPSGNISSWTTPVGFIWLKYTVEYKRNQRNLEELCTSLHITNSTNNAAVVMLYDKLHEALVVSKSYHWQLSEPARYKNSGVAGERGRRVLKLGRLSHHWNLRFRNDYL